MNNIEILAPAGNFQIAISAIDAGASAIYCGLDQFSARKSAQNLSKDELSRLKTYSVSKNCRIFVTINTLIKNEEIQNLIEVLTFLRQIEIDAVIIQDFGLLNIINKYFQDLTIHASTQMAIHNLEGALYAKSLGISRVVLARELSINEIEKIIKGCPGLEYECFIHGALCYSVSGKCMASGLLLNRSGNRGECAQICRSYYKLKSSNTNTYCFSCNDLSSDKDVLKLKEIGVTSLKIEGRMKDKNYVTSTISYYKNIFSNSSDQQINLSKFESKLSFSRKETKSYLHGIKNNIINNKYPGHLGIEIGNILHKDNTSITIQASSNILQNDTLMYFSKSGPQRFQAFKLQFLKQKNQYKIHNLPKLEMYDEGRIFLIQRGKQNFTNIDYKSIKPFKKIYSLHASISNNKLTYSYRDIAYTKELFFEASSNNNLYQNINSQLSKNNDAFYCFQIDATQKNIFDNLFLPPSIIKQLAKEIYQNIKIDETLQIETFTYENAQSNEMIDRIALSPKHSEIPFISEIDLELQNLSYQNNVYYMPIGPFIPDFTTFKNKLEEFLRQHKDKQFCLGLNNISHLTLLKNYQDDSNINFFIDMFLYCLNDHAYSFIKSLSNKIEFIISPVEFFKASKPSLLIKDKSIVPLFISRACFLKNNNLLECSKCDKNERIEYLSNGKNNFKVVTKNCLSYLFQI